MHQFRLKCWSLRCKSKLNSWWEHMTTPPPTPCCFLRLLIIQQKKLVTGIKNLGLNFWSNISRMRQSVASPDETPRKEFKIRSAAEYFWRTLRWFIWWWNTVSNAWYYFSNKMILDGEIKVGKVTSFSSDFQQSLKIYLFCISLRKEQTFGDANPGFPPK